MNFIALVLSFVIAQLIAGFIAIAIFMNQRVLKWFTKKYTKLVTEISEELEDLF